MDKLVPTVNDIVDSFIDQIKIMKDVSEEQFTVLMRHLNHKIIVKLFARDAEKVK